MNKLECMPANWKEERHMLNNKEVRDLDLNAKISYADDEMMLVNDDYEELRIKQAKLLFLVIK